MKWPKNKRTKQLHEKPHPPSFKSATSCWLNRSTDAWWQRSFLLCQFRKIFLGTWAFMILSFSRQSHFPPNSSIDSRMEYILCFWSWGASLRNVPADSANTFFIRLLHALIYSHISLPYVEHFYQSLCPFFASVVIVVVALKVVACRCCCMRRRRKYFQNRKSL